MYSKGFSNELEKRLYQYGPKDTKLPVVFPKGPVGSTEGIRYLINYCGGFDLVLHLCESMAVLNPNYDSSYEIAIKSSGQSISILFTNMSTNEIASDMIPYRTCFKLGEVNLVFDCNILKLKNELYKFYNTNKLYK